MLDDAPSSWISPDMMPLRSTRHVFDMIVERGLERAWVERMAADAECTEPSQRRQGVVLRFGRVAAAGGKVLRITPRDENGLVLTAHFDRKATQTVRIVDAHDL
jgi:hypothetical protein